MLFMLILWIKWLRKSIIPSYDDNHVNPFSLAFAIGIFFKRPIHKSKSSTGAIKHMELCKKAQLLVIHDFNDIQQLEIIFICHFTGFRPWSYWLCHDTRITALRPPFWSRVINESTDAVIRESLVSAYYDWKGSLYFHHGVYYLKMDPSVFTYDVCLSILKGIPLFSVILTYDILSYMCNNF